MMVNSNQLQQHCFSVNDKNYIFDGLSMTILSESREQKTMSQLIFSKNQLALGTLVLNITNNCNLACSYCYANKGNYDIPGKVMSFDTAKKSIDLLFESARINKLDLVSICFFGGEPLLEFDLIKSIVGYVKIYHADIKSRFLITTNGTILNIKISNFMIRNSFLVTISLDGNKEVHDKSRKYINGNGSYDRVVSRLSKKIWKLNPTARLTISNNNSDVCSSIIHLVKLGFKRITFALDYHLTKSNFQNFVLSLERLFEIYLLEIKNNKIYDISNISEIITSIALKKPKLTHCNAGLSYLSISADGIIYRCPRLTGLSEYSIGSVTNVKLDEIVSKSREMKFKISDENYGKDSNCFICPFILLCGGQCYYHIYQDDHDVNHLTRSDCLTRKQLIEKTLKLICLLSETERRRLILSLKYIWVGGD